MQVSSQPVTWRNRFMVYWYVVGRNEFRSYKQARDVALELGYPVHLYVRLFMVYYGPFTVKG